MTFDCVLWHTVYGRIVVGYVCVCVVEVSFIYDVCGDGEFRAVPVT